MRPSESAAPTRSQTATTLVVGAPGRIDEGHEVLPGRVVTLGSDSMNSIEIAHPSVAAFHLKLHAVLRADAANEDGAPPLPPRPVLVAETVGDASLIVNGRRHRGRVRLGGGVQFQIGAVLLEVGHRRVADTVDVGFRRQLLEDARRMMHSAPWYAVSIMVHALLMLILAGQVWFERKESQDRVIFMDSRSTPVDVLDDTFAVRDREEAEDPVVATEEEVAEFEDPTPSATPAIAEIEGAFQNLPSTFGIGPAGVRHGDLMGGSRLSLSRVGGGADGLGQRLGELRGRGLDVVFALDCTSSMRPFLAQAKAAIDRTVTRLAALVPDLRIGMVAYRDHESVGFTTRQLDLSSDRYEILNFLEDLDTQDGGIDIPEAVTTALEVATMNSSWRPKAFRVVVLVGDAPPKAHSMNRMELVIRSFVGRKQDDQAMISSMFAGPLGARHKGKRVEKTFAEIAKLGHGSTISLGTGILDELERRLLLVTVGQQYAEQLEEAIASLESDPRRELIRARAAAGDVDWLLRKLQHRAVHPDVVHALIELSDRDLRDKLRGVSADPTTTDAARRAAHYVLRKTGSDPDGRPGR